MIVMWSTIQGKLKNQKNQWKDQSGTELVIALWKMGITVLPSIINEIIQIMLSVLNLSQNVFKSKHIKSQRAGEERL